MSSPTVSHGDDPFVHPALFYSGRSEYLAGTVPFILEGLTAGEPVAVAVPRPNLELLRAELGSTADRVQLLDMGEAGRNPGRILAEVLHAAADPHPQQHVRIIGEPIWPTRSELEYPACLQHEALINLAFRGRQVTILCPYDAARLDPTVLADAEQTHPVLVDHGGERLSNAYAPYEAITRANTPLPEPFSAQAFCFDTTCLADARHFARKAADHAGLDENRTDDFTLAIGELAANSIRHGGGRGTLRVWTEDGMLTGEISDAGRPTDLLAGRRRPELSQRGGRGLVMVHHLADLVRTHTGPGGLTTRVYLRL